MRFFVTFLALNLLLSSFFIDLAHYANTLSRALPVQSLFESGTLAIDKHHEATIDKSFINGHYYSDKAPLSTFLVIPFYGVLHLFHLIPGTWIGPRHTAIVLGDLICGTTPFVILITFLFLSLAKGASSMSPVLLSMLPIYSSFLFVYTGTYFGHLPAGLFLFLAYYFLHRKSRYALSGCLLGLGLLTEYLVGLAAPIWTVQILLTKDSRNKALRFFIGLCPGACLAALYNKWITGSFLTPPYHYVSYPLFSDMKENYGFSFPHAGALWQLTLGPYRGLFLYSPLFAFLVYHLARSAVAHLNWKRLLTHPGIVLCVVYLLFISSYYQWSGGSRAWGPRHLIPITFILIYEGVRCLARTSFSRPIFFILISIGLLFGWSAKSTHVFLFQSSLPTILGTILFDFRTHTVNANNLLTLLFGLSPFLAVCAWPLLFAASLFLLEKLYRPPHRTPAPKTGHHIIRHNAICFQICSDIPQKLKTAIPPFRHLHRHLRTKDTFANLDPG